MVNIREEEEEEEEEEEDCIHQVFGRLIKTVEYKARLIHYKQYEST